MTAPEVETLVAKLRSDFYRDVPEGDGWSWERVTNPTTAAAATALEALAAENQELHLALVKVLRVAESSSKENALFNLETVRMIAASALADEGDG